MNNSVKTGGSGSSNKGIYIYDGSNNNLIKNNTLTKNRYCAVNIRKSSMNTVIGNNISDNNIGIHIPSTENNIKQNTFSNNNKKYDEEILTPGFELIISITIILLFIIWNRMKKLNRKM